MIRRLWATNVGMNTLDSTADNAYAPYAAPPIVHFVDTSPKMRPQNRHLYFAIVIGIVGHDFPTARLRFVHARDRTYPWGWVRFTSGLVGNGRDKALRAMDCVWRSCAPWAVLGALFVFDQVAAKTVQTRYRPLARLLNAILLDLHKAAFANSRHHRRRRICPPAPVRASHGLRLHRVCEEVVGYESAVGGFDLVHMPVVADRSNHR